MNKVDELLQSAQAQGAIGGASVQILGDLGQQIQAGLGINVDDVQASEVVLVTVMPDDSGSMRPNAALVRTGHNEAIAALQKSKQSDSVFVHTRYLNGHVLFPYSALGGAVKMDGLNYDPNLGTPLYDQTVVLLGTVLAKTQEFLDAGVPVRTVTLIITDGADAGSVRANAQTVATLVADMKKQERHTVCAMGISDGSTDFRQVFADMGIDQVLTPANQAGEIRKAFALFSQSAVRATQGATLGGFLSP